MSLHEKFDTVVNIVNNALDALEEKVLGLLSTETTKSAQISVSATTLQEEIKRLHGLLDSQAFSNFEKELLNLLIAQREHELCHSHSSTTKSQRQKLVRTTIIKNSSIIESLIATAKADQARKAAAVKAWLDKKNAHLEFAKSQNNRLEKAKIAIQENEQELKSHRAAIAYDIWIAETETKQSLERLAQSREQMEATLATQHIQDEKKRLNDQSIKQWNSKKTQELLKWESEQKQIKLNQEVRNKERKILAENQYKKWLLLKNQRSREQKQLWAIGDKTQLEVVLNLNKPVVVNRTKEIKIPQYFEIQPTKLKPEWV